jgi:hypothetical protein
MPLDSRQMARCPSWQAGGGVEIAIPDCGRSKRSGRLLKPLSTSIAVLRCSSRAGGCGAPLPGLPSPSLLQPLLAIYELAIMFRICTAGPKLEARQRRGSRKCIALSRIIGEHDKLGCADLKPNDFLYRARFARTSLRALKKTCKNPFARARRSVFVVSLRPASRKSFSINPSACARVGANCGAK